MLQAVSQTCIPHTRGGGPNFAKEAEMEDRKTHYWKIYAPLFTKGETCLPFENGW